ncbi:hypothetical protein AVEN_56856-1 [Araneus ventricosus]|uniref:Uncharacterized protein n=1 Tax=Araneus ventricosus TaxID=182803 RepID=A0A4Y2T7Y7_ARAVE|nr:hypothetical protein AVEN_56856-1 [Araneus ventricosus]
MHENQFNFSAISLACACNIGPDIGRFRDLASANHSHTISEASVAYWKVLGYGAGGFQDRDPISLKICRIWGLLHAKSYVVAKRSTWCGVEV